jgi:hypothetical protein
MDGPWLHVAGYAGLTGVGITLLLTVGRIVALLIVLRGTTPRERPELIEALATLFAVRRAKGSTPRRVRRSAGRRTVRR